MKQPTEVPVPKLLTDEERNEMLVLLNSIDENLGTIAEAVAATRNWAVATFVVELFAVLIFFALIVYSLFFVHGA
jgi:electron transfer flavoprotein alpha/beta subunit